MFQKLQKKLKLMWMVVSKCFKKPETPEKASIIVPSWTMKPGPCAPGGPWELELFVRKVGPLFMVSSHHGKKTKKSVSFQVFKSGP
jgi:hypothetical protein